MGRKAGVISIDVQAGTGKFILDLEKAKGAVREFGSSSKSSMAASSAALRELEGNFGNNTRAVSRFLSQTLGLGPVLQAAFPIVGGLAFGGMLVGVGKNVYEFFKNMQEGPRKIAEAFTALNGPLRITNDELRVTNDRLENDIAKLEGKRQNTLKLALDEARLSADKLAESLEKDLSSIDKLLKENHVGTFAQVFFGKAGTKDLEEQFWKKFTPQVHAIDENERTGLRAAQQIKDPVAAQKAMDAVQAQAYEARRKVFEDEIRYVSGIIDTAAKPHTAGKGTIFEQNNDPSKRADLLNAANGLRQNLEDQLDRINNTESNRGLSRRKSGLEAGAANAELDRPFRNALKTMDAQIEGIGDKLGAVGKSEAFKVVAEAAAEAKREITRLNEELEKRHTKLTADQEAAIKGRTALIAQGKADLAWAESMQSTKTTVEERVQSLNMLTEAIGKSYEATKRANVETRVMQAMKERYSDPSFAGDAAKLRGQFGAEFDAQHNQQTTAATDKLRTQIELERSLAAVQAQGAEAVRMVTLAYRLREMTMAGATREQIKAEIELFNATRANQSAAAVAELNQKIAATEKMTAAVLKGAEAQRKAGLEAKYAEMIRAGATPEQLAGQKRLDEAEHQQQITQEALKTGMAYKNQLEALDQQIAALKTIRTEQGDSLELEISLRNLENERLKVLVQETLQLRGAKDGVKAFFIEMQEDAKSAADIVYDALHSAFDKATDQLTNLFTGKKTDFRKMLDEIGTQIVHDSIKSGLQRGLGAIGKRLGIDGKNDGNSRDKAFWVRLADGPSGQPGTANGTRPSGTFGDGAIGRFIFSLFGGGGGGGFGGGGQAESVSSNIEYRAMGGDVDPGRGYWVGENEPEYFNPGRSGTITPLSKMGGSHVYHIDARGAALGVENRISRAIDAAHNAAVSNSVRANAERAARTPRRS
jgi:hypothetical protein